MGRTLRTVAVVGLAALFTGTAASASYGAIVDGSGVNAPVPIDAPSGQYIVLLDEASAATYEGGAANLRATKPQDGAKLDTNSAEVKEYSAYLDGKQQEVAAEAGAARTSSYTLAVNGFSATLTAAQAAKLANTRGVDAVVPDEIRHPDAVPSTEFLGLEGDGGVWDEVGGIDAAGAGIVVGVVDTGIAPENPSFAGEPLGTTPGAEPYLDGNEVVFAKADGTVFRSERVTGDEWSLEDYSTKLVGAQYFSEGAAATGFDFQWDMLSPRDGAGHGSHTASTAAGNNGVDATVEGRDFGAISGVAPAAKVASYKACYEGPDPLVTTDDICALSDLLGAINAAIDDGVDVINYSIGGGAASTTLATEDRAFFNAAAAGIFVSASAGNDGPDPVTADHASPWYTTVAASTIPTYEGTVTLPNGFEAAGATVSVPEGEEITAPVVYAGDIPAAGADPEEAALCYIGSIDAAAADGNIVVCDRGGNARVEKSQAVDEAGGIGAIIVNVTPGSLDNDFHSVPTVHISDIYRDDLLDYVQNTDDATATLVGENITGVETPTPQVAGFSSRGPMLADGSDILKPDITGPGVAILAATNNREGDESTFGFLSGTSMSAPHIAGLAALYLGERPDATPAEVKSAMMTTAYDTVDEAGGTFTDPFSQGAGHVDPTKYFEPGLLYLNGPDDWAAFLEGKGLAEFDDVEPIDGSDLNLASIAIGSLAQPQTVTRTVTATQAGTFTASIDVPGLDAVVEPSTLTFGAAGESQPFTVTFSRTTAPTEEWATGFLTWTSGTTAVRSPIAVQPVTADAPEEVTGTGVTGSTDVEITPGLTGPLPLNVSGLAPLELLEDTDNPVEGHSGDQDSGADTEGTVSWVVDVPEGTTLSRFTLDSSDDEGSDLDLFVYRVVAPDDLRYYEMWQSATGSADEQVTLDQPTAGTYLVEANVFSFTEPFTWDLTYANVEADGEGALTATPNPIDATQGTPVTYALSWEGLDPDTRYLGVSQYADSAVRTVLTVDAGAAAPVNTALPTISGTPRAGETLTADPGEWEVAGDEEPAPDAAAARPAAPGELQFSYQWLRAGEPIEGATAQTYVAAEADVDTLVSVRVTAIAEDSAVPGVADSEPVFVVAAVTATPSPSPSDSAAPAFPGLAATGSDGIPYLLIGAALALVLLGGAITVARHRRRA